MTMENEPEYDYEYDFEETVIITGTDTKDFFKFEDELNALIEKYGYKRD